MGTWGQRRPWGGGWEGNTEHSQSPQEQLGKLRHGGTGVTRVIFATLCCGPIHAFCSLPTALCPPVPHLSPAAPGDGQSWRGAAAEPLSRAAWAQCPWQGWHRTNCAPAVPARPGAGRTLGWDSTRALHTPAPLPWGRGSRAFVPGPLSGICSLRRRQHQSTDWSHFGAPAATRPPLGRTRLEYVMASSPPGWQCWGSCS